ncbi:ferritin family protein [Tianweitania populi]|uniref:Rubrerythrin diiron-binding domain-containing protein n=1 Tax=Tianweitania populi TaxID=1607949 RepID=A0A8J3DMR1_9HYPH|nr:ferritin family protein [Tianweitania populi]GHD07613.1 hypothetical protein GCM10016234_06200 [Tianweitania populi]
MNHREPWMLNFMDELLVQARAMEQEAIAGYHKLAERMRQANRPDLTAVFEALIREEEGHLGNVESWMENSTFAAQLVQPPSEPMFDDEGAALVAPELLDAYRAFAVAVRNEERAFVFWTYVAAHAASNEIRHAAEKMAREELGHVATLRRERRRAFHDLREKRELQSVDLFQLETHLAHHLDRLARQVGPEKHALHSLAEKAVLRAKEAKNESLGNNAPVADLPEQTAARPLALAEWLLDFYLNRAENEDEESTRRHAQSCAADLVSTIYRINGPTHGG